MSSNFLAIGSDNVLTLSGLYDSVSSGFVANATVTGTLKLGTTNVYQFALPSLPNPGDYQGLLPYAVTNVLTPDAAYSLQVDVVTSGGNYYRKINGYTAQVATDQQ